MLALHVMQSLVSVFAPIVSIMKRLGQRWGTLFGIKAMASTALGDDLGFERILSVNQNSDMIPTVMVRLNDDTENAMLLRASAGSDEVVKQFYHH